MNLLLKPPGLQGFGRRARQANSLGFGDRDHELSSRRPRWCPRPLAGLTQQPAGVLEAGTLCQARDGVYNLSG